MKHFRILFALITAIALTSPSWAQDEKEDKIGTVDIGRLVTDYHVSKTTRETFAGYQEDIKKQDAERVETLKAIDEESKKIQQDADDPSLSAEKRDELFKKASAKRAELKGLMEDRAAWLKRKQAQLNQKANMEFSEIRNSLVEIIKAVGDELGYDYIFDRSGASGAGVAILVYTKDATDLTGLLLERINKDAPVEQKSE